jgi:uncharacterized membrane protein YhdT
MYFSCPVCNHKSILFPTKALHVNGSTGSSVHNRFACTHCGAILACAYSPLPFFIIGALAQLFITGSGVISDLWIGGLLCAFAAIFIFPIKEAAGIFTAQRNPPRAFRDPIDQGWYYVETRLLSLAVAFLAAWLMFAFLTNRHPGMGGHAGDLIYLLPVALAVIAALWAFSAFIYRIGRGGWGLRLLVDAGLLLAFLALL